MELRLSALQPLRMQVCHRVLSLHSGHSPQSRDVGHGTQTTTWLSRADKREDSQMTIAARTVHCTRPLPSPGGNRDRCALWGRCGHDRLGTAICLSQALAACKAGRLSRSGKAAMLSAESLRQPPAASAHAALVAPPHHQERTSE